MLNMRPWKLEEVPIGGILKVKTGKLYRAGIIQGATQDGNDQVFIEFSRRDNVSVQIAFELGCWWKNAYEREDNLGHTCGELKSKTDIQEEQYDNNC